MINQKNASPAVAALMNVLNQQIPFLSGFYPHTVRRDHEGNSIAHGKGARLQYGAGPRKQTSHLAGLALDIFLASQSHTQRILAHHLITTFITYSAEMGWSQIIYESSNFLRHNNSVTHRVYTFDRDHFNHIHIDWWQHGAIRGEEVIIPARASNAGFAHSMRNDLGELNRNWNAHQLAPLSLSIDPLGLSAIHNIGR